MIIAAVAWVEVFVVLALRWLILNERLERIIQEQGDHPYLSRDELMELLVENPKSFARTAPREWWKGLLARTSHSSHPNIERTRTSGNRGYTALFAYIFVGTPLLGLGAAVLARVSLNLLVATWLLLQLLLIGYWLQRLWDARRSSERFAVVVSACGIAAVIVATAVGTLFVIYR